MKSETPLREINAWARAGLMGSWGRSMGVIVVYAILLVGVVTVPYAGVILMLIFAPALVAGIHMYFLACVRKMHNPLSLLLDGFGQFGTSWCAFMLAALVMLAWTAPIMALIPAVVLFVHLDPATFPAYTLPAIYALITLTASGLLIALQMRYYFVLYLVADDPSLRAREAVHRSVELMEGNYWRLAVLWLRFTGWQAVAVLTVGIGFLWLIPYMCAATAMFYRDIKDRA